MSHHPDYDYFTTNHPTPQALEPAGIDWDLVMEITPALFSATCWILWGAFLLIPSIFDLHYAAMFSTTENAIYVGMGFVLCMSISTAIRAGHGATAVFFAVGILLLSFWF